MSYGYRKHTPRIGSSQRKATPFVWNGSAWVEHPAYIWGEITNCWLYNKGDENVDITGGWISEGRFFNEATPGEPTPLILTKESGSMTITNNFTHDYDNRSGIARPANAIDLTNYSVLRLHYDCSLPNCIAYFAILPVGATYWQSNLVATHDFANATKTGATTTLDVSALTGAYNVCIAMLSWAANNWVKVYELELT